MLTLLIKFFKSRKQEKVSDLQSGVRAGVKLSEWRRRPLAVGPTETREPRLSLRSPGFKALVLKKPCVQDPQLSHLYFRGPYLIICKIATLDLMMSPKRGPPVYCKRTSQATCEKHKLLYHVSARHRVPRNPILGLIVGYILSSRRELQSGLGIKLKMHILQHFSAAFCPFLFVPFLLRVLALSRSGIREDTHGHSHPVLPCAPREQMVSLTKELLSMSLVGLMHKENSY